MANDNEIKIVIQVATAGGKASIKDFTNTTEREMGKVGQSAKKLGASLKSYLGWAAAGAVVAKGFNRMIDKGAEYQQQLADLQAITGIAGEDLDGLSNRALDASVQYGESASNIIEANKLVASQLADKIDFGTAEGIEELKQVSEQAIVLQKAAGIDLRTAVETTTTALNQFNAPASQTNRIINSIAAGAKFGAAEARDQSEAYAEAGSVFAAANEDMEVLNASTQILAQNAIKGRRAGTGLRNVMTILQSEAQKLADNGITDVNVNTDGFIESLRKLKPLQEDTAALAEIFGRENLTAAQILIKNIDAVERMNEKVRGTQTAYEQASIQLNTFKGAQSQLSSAMDKELIESFQEANGFGVELLQTMTSLVTMAGNAVEAINDMMSRSDRIRNIAGTDDNWQFGFNQMLGFDAEKEEQAADVLDKMVEETRWTVNEINRLGAQVDVFSSDLMEAEEGTDYFDQLKSKIAAARGELEYYQDWIQKDIQVTKTSIQTKKEKGQEYGLEEEQLKELQKQYAAVNSILNENTGNVKKEAAAVDELVGEKGSAGSGSGLSGLTGQIEVLQEEYDAIINQSGRFSFAKEQEARAIKMVIDQLKEEQANRLARTGQGIRRAGDPGVAPLERPRDPLTEEQRNWFQERLAGTGEEADKAKESVDELADAGQVAFERLEGSITNSLGTALDRTIEGLFAMEGKMIDIEQIGRRVFSSILSGTVKFLVSSAVTSATGGTGGLFSSIFGFGSGRARGGRVLAASTGGKVFGPGTTTSDSIPTLLSNREYVVNASSADSMPDLLDDANRDPAVARRLNAMYKQFKTGKDYSGRRPALSVIDRVIEINNNAQSTEGFDNIVRAIDNQTQRLEAVERKIQFNVSEFNDAKQKHELKEQDLGRG